MNRSFILTALLAFCVPSAFADNQGNNAELMSAQKAYRSAMTNYTQQKENVAELQAKADDLNKRIAGLHKSHRMLLQICKGNKELQEDQGLPMECE